MYRIEFLQFNELMQEVMSEEDTLQNIIDIWLDSKPNKEQKNILQVQKNGLSMPLKIICFTQCVFIKKMKSLPLYESITII